MSRLQIDPHALRRARLERALSQRALAQVAAVHPNTVYHAENGWTTRADIVGKLANALGVKPTSIARIVEK